MASGFTAPPPGQPPPGQPMARRPATVTIAGLLLLVVTVCSVAFLGSRIAVHDTVRRLYEEAFAGTELADYIGTMMAFTYVDAGVYVLFGLVLGILAIFVMAGKNGARIATWSVGGLGGCCGAVSLLGVAFGATASYFGSGVDSAEAEEIERILTEETPAWYEPVNIGSSLLGVLALVAALILLAVPVSNAFFRKTPDPTFAPPSYGPQPPYPPPAYPPQPPAYPPQPPAYPPQPPPSYGPPPQVNPPPQPPTPADPDAGGGASGSGGGSYGGGGT